MISYRQADLINRLKTYELKKGDRVRVKREIALQLGKLSDNYVDNVGTIESISIYYDPDGDVKVRWDKPTGSTSKDNVTSFRLPSLERAF